MTEAQSQRTTFRLSPEVRDRILAIADEAGVSLNAFVEAYFLETLDRFVDPEPPVFDLETFKRWRERVVETARAIDAERRRRRARP